MNKPPHWIDKVLEWFCASALLEEVQGDLHELYGKWVHRFGIRKANRLYCWHALRFFRPFALKRNVYPHSNSLLIMNMYKHYITVAFRNLIRNKAFSSINMVGLALGMTCCLFIFLWVQDEKSIDNFHTKGDQLYTVYQTAIQNGRVSGSYTSPVRYENNRRTMPLAEITEGIPEIENITFYATGYELPWGHPETFQVGEKIYKLEGSRAGANFFNMLDYEVIAGNPKTALQDKSSIAISRKMANMFFDSPQAALGQSIRYENRLDFTITAIFEDVTAQSSLQFDFLINWESQLTNLEWSSPDALTMIQLAENADIQQVQNDINRLLEPYADPNLQAELTMGLQPFREHYLVSNFVNGKPQGGRIEYVEIFSGVAIFILLIACINFMNLATARSVKRAKEVGVRKVIGSSRFYLIGQFLGESILMSFFALVLSVVLVQVCLPLFNNFTGKQIASPFIIPTYWFILLGLMIMTGLLAGSYPAFYLSSLKPVSVLKGVVRFTSSSVWFRKGLAVFQFGLSILLLIATLVVSQQTKFIQNAHLGYDRENLVYIQIEGELNNKYELLKQELLSQPGIAMVDRSSEAPHNMNFLVDENGGHVETATGDDAINWEGKRQGESVAFKPASVGYDFMKIMDLEVVEGRGFSEEITSDSADAFMVNEEAVKEMGMKDPIGKWISAWDKKGHIIGVLKDYHTSSLHDQIRPLVIDVKEYEYFGVILVRTEPGKTKEALAGMESVFREVNPNYPFDYKFVDQEYGELYKSEQVTAKLSNVFAGLAIIISCLGLLGLVMFSAEQRVKEIGIRKVLGAKVIHILGILSVDFLKLVVIAFIIAAPIAGYFMNEWLQGFAYKINLSWWIFALAGGGALFIALITIGYQTIQSALVNPVESLKNE